MRIAIGSTREPKVEAVKEAWEVFGSKVLDDPEESVKFLSYDVTGTGPSMPLSIEDLMKGAQSRAESLMLQLKREKIDADFYIGLEGGFNIVNSLGRRRYVFLESWAFVSDAHNGYFGHSGGIYIPPHVVEAVVDRGIELGIVIDKFSSKKNVSGKQGTWGILTRDILSRRHSFVIALIAAFAPFYNRDAYVA